VDILSSRVILRPVDYERTVEFYRDGLELAIAREYPGGTVFFAGQSLIEVAGHARAADARTGFAGALWLQVRDADETAAALVTRGIALDRGPVREPWGLIEMWLRDPDDMPIVLVQVPGDHPLRRDTRPHKD
jgi:catechol 2,3-dioxygenase-like lactoylglutathione lyase family enzyme